MNSIYFSLIKDNENIFNFIDFVFKTKALPSIINGKPALTNTENINRYAIYIDDKLIDITANLINFKSQQTEIFNSTVSYGVINKNEISLNFVDVDFYNDFRSNIPAYSFDFKTGKSYTYLPVDNTDRLILPISSRVGFRFYQPWEDAYGAFASLYVDNKHTNIEFMDAFTYFPLRMILKNDRFIFTSSHDFTKLILVDTLKRKVVTYQNQDLENLISSLFMSVTTQLTSKWFLMNILFDSYFIKINDDYSLEIYYAANTIPSITYTYDNDIIVNGFLQLWLPSSCGINIRLINITDNLMDDMIQLIPTYTNLLSLNIKPSNITDLEIYDEISFQKQESALQPSFTKDFKIHYLDDISVTKIGNVKEGALAFKQQIGNLVIFNDYRLKVIYDMIQPQTTNISIAVCDETTNNVDYENAKTRDIYEYSFTKLTDTQFLFKPSSEFYKDKLVSENNFDSTYTTLTVFKTENNPYFIINLLDASLSIDNCFSSQAFKLFYDQTKNKFLMKFYDSLDTLVSYNGSYKVQWHNLTLKFDTEAFNQLKTIDLNDENPLPIQFTLVDEFNNSEFVRAPIYTVKPYISYFSIEDIVSDAYHDFGYQDWVVTYGGFEDNPVVNYPLIIENLPPDLYLKIDMMIDGFGDGETSDLNLLKLVTQKSINNISQPTICIIHNLQM